MEKIKIVTVVGPTASGKTSLAVKLAQLFDGEVISADSMQVYKGMDIATAKPDEKEMCGIPHHLISIISPDEEFSVSRFKEMAENAAKDISSRGKLPILAGGTGLYVDTLLNNTTFLDNTKNDEIRALLQSRIEKEGNESLYKELLEKDPEAAEKIHPNNSLKIIRALEIFYSSGSTLTEQNVHSHENESIFESLIIGLNALDRDVLYNRINMRVDIMIENGLVEETRKFFETETASTACQAIGYKELKPYIDGNLSLEEAAENLKQSTRRYAKRQLTWFRRNEKIRWFNIDEFSPEELVKEAELAVKEFLK
ncbi:MAG: tRNA (adenosine(37)-N6)-dimethylallyltransferase MiaA [Ruminococcaceae bacterium]|nr:tRNA (adenosine(37)-N6)-dimethylallyltransferase MiaA [Oscillospiraceae bacterium]